MDIGSRFWIATELHAPQALLLYAKFHVLQHLADALDRVRRSEYKRLEAKNARAIHHKGQRYQLAVALGKSQVPRLARAEAPRRSQPATECCLFSEGVIWPAQLRARGLGLAILLNQGCSPSGGATEAL